MMTCLVKASSSFPGNLELVDIRCDFNYYQQFRKDGYSCNVIDLVISSDSIAVNNVIGTHPNSDENMTSSDENLDNMDVSYLLVFGQTFHYFPSGIENFLPNLMLIRVQGSHLKHLAKANLRPFYKIQVLDLKYNDIESVDGDLFSHSPILKLLDLRGNKIRRIGLKILTPLLLIREIYLYDNICINEGALNEDSEVLNLLNQIARQCLSTSKNGSADKREFNYNVDGNVSCSDSETIVNQQSFCNISKQTIDGVQFAITNSSTSIKILEITGEDVKYLPIKVADNFPELEAYHVISCYVNFVTKSNFENLIVLTNLSIVNSHLQFVADETFSDLVSLVELSLNKNRLEYLSKGFFKNMKSLRRVNLSQNEIMLIYEETFYNLSELQWLWFSLNKLRKISDKLFHRNLKLETINLRSNQLELKSTKAFVNLTNLRSLYLSGNVCKGENLCGNSFMNVS